MPTVATQTTAKTAGTGQTAGPVGTAGSVAQGGYSLAGSRPPGPDRETYVQDGYRKLNPNYEKQESEPTFSLGSNLPRTVRGWQQKKKNNEGKDSTGTAPGVPTGDKGEAEAAPQLQNIDDRKNQRGNSGQTGEAQRDTRPPGPQQQPSVALRQAHAKDDQGRDLGIVGDEPIYSSGAGSEDDVTLAPEDEGDDVAVSFNRWSLMRTRFQDALGEWLGVSFLPLHRCCCDCLADLTSRQPSSLH